MKKVLTSVSLMAIGATGLHAQYAPNLSPQETSKPWSLTASLRGFYDDNYLTQPNTTLNGLGKVIHPVQSSYGTEVSPAFSFNHSEEQTLIGLSYVYDLRWYEAHSTTDQSHQLNAKLDHAFSERYKIAATDSFVIAQEPTVIDPGVVSSPLRTSGSNVRNTGTLDFTAELTKELDLHLGY